MKFTLPSIQKEYRPELNGLRALAVILVLLFHLDYEWMKGGFLGVDIFLVISGYFISKNILYELQIGTFSFKGFYTKRLRRLFPALIFTTLIVLLAGYFLLTPSNYERLGQSSIFASLSVSNFFFWSESGYFNADAYTKPLLHMWSLSLEEQFYLFWPILLVTLFRFLRKYMLRLMVLLVICSLLLAEFYFFSDPDATFFLIPFRMFEFLLGAACIWLERFHVKKRNYLLETYFLIGLVLIVFSAVKFNNRSKMPGLLSLIPCAGAMLIILGGKARLSSWTLKNKAIELIGKSSYSIYLIHWPLIVYYQYWTLSTLSSNKEKIGLISISLGILMWYFIENTFRYRKHKKTLRDPIWIAVPVLIFGISIVSGAVWKSEGVPSRFTNELYMTKNEILENRKMYFDNYNENENLLKGNSKKGHVIIMGNSHSVDLIFTLRQNGFEAKITALKSLGKCFNFGESFEESFEQLCTERKLQNLANENWSVVNAIYLHDNWPIFESKGLIGITKKIRAISSAPIFVFGPKMTFRKPIPEIVRSSNSVSAVVINDYAREFAREKQKITINDNLKKEFLNPYYEKNIVFYVDILSLQLGENMNSYEIVSTSDLKFLYFDDSHFTKQGSKELGEKMKLNHPYLFNLERLNESYPISEERPLDP